MRHLGKNDPEPVINPDKITLYDFKFCPFCQRVRYTLDYHKIPYDRVLINLIAKPEWYLRLNPEGRVPLLRYQGQKLSESDLVMRYVDESLGKPEDNLLKVCGEQAFKDALTLVSNFTQPRYRIVYLDTGSKADVDDFIAACGKIDEAIKEPYFCGDRVSLVDMAVAPFLNGWSCVMQQAKSLDPSFNEDALNTRFPKLHRYRLMMQAQPYAAATAFSEDEYADFVKIYRAKDESAVY